MQPSAKTTQYFLRDRDFIQVWMPFWEWVYRHYFRVQTGGWQHIPAGQALFVGSHSGGLVAPDMYMFMVDWFRRVGYERSIYGLMHPSVWQMNPHAASYAAKLGAVPAKPRFAIAALRQNASVLVYPGGAQDVFRPHRRRQQICFFNRQGFIKLALREQVPIVPLVAWGAHDTLIVLEDIYPLIRQLHDWGLIPWLNGVDPEVFPVYLGLPWGLALGPLPNIPLPVQIHTKVCAPVTFERYGRAAAKDADYVEACYQRVVAKMQQALDQLAADATT
ncbi:MAG: acyltransferase family protein [Leptolyngbya sp. SIO4C1]|nr:acyltransferase family protein [Leptolyngbya sp. SIO4C1]